MWVALVAHLVCCPSTKAESLAAAQGWDQTASCDPLSCLSSIVLLKDILKIEYWYQIGNQHEQPEIGSDIESEKVELVHPVKGLPKRVGMLPVLTSEKSINKLFTILYAKIAQKYTGNNDAGVEWQCLFVLLLF